MTTKMTFLSDENKYSFSKVNSFYNCPYSYYRKYFEHEQGIGNETANFGSFVHLILEKYSKGELKIEELLPFYTENYDKYVGGKIILNFSGFKKDLSKNYYQDGYNYFLNFQGFEGYKILEAEKYYIQQVPSTDIYFNGQIDLILEDEHSNIILCDHKSKKKFYTKKEQEEYTRQLYLYSRYVVQTYKRFPSKLIFNMFRSEGFVVEDFNMTKYLEAWRWFLKCVNEIGDEIEFNAIKDSFYCLNFCGYRKKRDCFCEQGTKG